MGDIFDLPSKRTRLIEINQTISTSYSKEANIEHSSLKRVIDLFDRIDNMISELDIYFQLAMEESDENEIQRISDVIPDLIDIVGDFELQQMFKDDDLNNAIISINSGAGGMEAQDWSRMLFRMYQRWAEKHGFRFEIMNIIKTDNDGIKNVDFIIGGRFAYGMLKVETGVHRLVRNSPFDAKNSRHTSFSSVFVSPEIDDKIEIKIDDNDIRIDKFCASGPGGQHVNKTESAIRITHLPTKIVVSCQNEKSQHSNQETAMRLLRSKLYELELRKQREKIQKLHDEKSDISWGNQIRSYFLQPKVIIKDHRTNIEFYDADRILGGDIDHFLRAALLSTDNMV